MSDLVHQEPNCYSCGSSHTTFTKQNYPKWYINRGTDLKLCHYCYSKLVSNLRYYHENRDKCLKQMAEYYRNNRKNGSCWGKPATDDAARIQLTQLAQPSSDIANVR